MDNWIENDEIVFDCGCKFPIVSRDPLRWKVPTDITHITKHCKRTWDLFATGNTKGIFQLETRFGQQSSKKLMPECIEHLSGLMSIMRPGCLGNLIDGKSVTDKYIDRKNNREEINVFHEALRPILEKTYLLLIYQEGSLRIAQDIAGFDLQQADVLRKCIAKGSIVYTADGPRRIEDLCNKKARNYGSILTIDENNKTCYKPIVDVWNTGVQDVYKLSCEKGFNIKLTNKHKVFTQDGWKELKDITTDDFIAIPSSYTYKGNYVTSEDETIIISYLISEGYHVKGQSKITNADPWVLDIVRNALKNVGAKTKEYTHNGCTNIYIQGEYKKYLDKVVKLGKSRVKELPLRILGSTGRFANIFVGHYFTAEGHVSDTNLEISSTSYSIIQDLQALLLRNKIHASIIVKNGKYKGEPYQSYRLYISDYKDIMKFKVIYGEYICPRKLEAINNIKKVKYSNSRFLIPSCFIKAAVKNENVNLIFGEPCSGSLYNKNQTYDRANRLNQVLCSDMLEKVLSAGFKFVKVSKIEYEGKEETYDYTVGDDNIHCGFINGILVSNSIGKKKADLMSQIREEFVDGCVKNGVVDKEMGETLFNWISESSRYAFNKCLSPTTTVNTPSDIKTIADISIGDEVQIPILGSKKEGVCYSKVVNKYDQGIKKVWDVYFKDFSITCTIDHKFLCGDGTVRPLWHILLNNKHVVTKGYGEDCYSRITNIVDAGFQQTYDIEIEDERHLFYGNGIATSNSHSVSYAYNSYLSAYMKAHFPASFFTSYLFYAKDKQNRFEEAKLLINNARAMGIDVLTPDFRLDNIGFKRFDNQPKNINYYDMTADKIHFGFCDIKGVGRNKYNKFVKALNVVETYLDKTRDSWDWLTFLVYLSQDIESTITIAFIESGALDYFKVSRSKMLFEYEQFSTLTSKEIAWIKQNVKINSGTTLTDILERCILEGSGKGKCFANKNRVAKAEGVLKTIKSPPYSLVDSPEWISRVEEARLGVPLTCTLLDACKNQDQANCSIKDFKSGGKKNGLFIAGQVEDVKIILTRKGDEMAFLTLSDDVDTLECVIFPNKWETIKNKGICVVENCIMVTGEKSKEKDKDSLIVNDAFQLT